MLEPSKILAIRANALDLVVVVRTPVSKVAGIVACSIGAALVLEDELGTAINQVQKESRFLFEYFKNPEIMSVSPASATLTGKTTSEDGRSVILKIQNISLSSDAPHEGPDGFLHFNIKRKKNNSENLINDNYKFYTVDLNDEMAVNNLFKNNFYSSTFDIVIFLHGLIHTKLMFNPATGDLISLKDWDDVFDNNLRSNFILTREILANQIKKRFPSHLIYVSSIASQGFVGQVAYSSAKAGLEVFSKVVWIDNNSSTEVTWCFFCKLKINCNFSLIKSRLIGS
jgi:hypothetical protein